MPPYLKKMNKDSLLDERPVLLFDGVCNLCNGLVNFIIDQDPKGTFAFAALQSDAAASRLAPFGVTNETLDTVVLLADGQCYQKSDAALETLRRLGGAWALLYPLIALPRPVRDRAYDWLAANRYRWFGKRDSCRMPTPALRARFLDA